MPKISVVMSVYNTKEEYLRKAIESILNQTFRDFEFIIVNDASTDASASIIDEYKDERIVRIDNPVNYGLTVSLNKALKAARGEYIARMDADDISSPDRLRLQYDYMQRNKTIAVLGTYAKQLGTERILKPIKCLDDEHRRVKMLFRNSGVIHPTAMIRKKFLDEHNLSYNEAIKKGQDYALWAEIVTCGRIENIEIPLLEYRIHEGQISIKSKKEQEEYATMVKLQQIQQARIPLRKEEIDWLLSIEETASSDYDDLLRTIKKVIKWNNGQKYYNQSYLKKELVTLWFVRILRDVKHARDFSGFFRGYTYTILRPSAIKYFIFSVKNHEI